jgi:hypothetical protein
MLWNTNVSLFPLYCQEVVIKFSALTNGLGFPAHLKEEDARKTDQDFDVNQYFAVLDRLSMEPGYVLDYVYYEGGVGGEPVLYARMADQPAYRDYNELSKDRSIGSPLSEDEYLNHVRADESPESFFQLYVLQMLGGQFYLSWHANYDDYRIVCNSSEAELYLPDVSSTSGASSSTPISEAVAKAHRMDFNPVVEMNDSAVRVSAVAFTKWGGFILKSITFKREFPHEVLNMDSNVLVRYDCGINYSGVNLPGVERSRTALPLLEDKIYDFLSVLRRLCGVDSK